MSTLEEAQVCLRQAQDAAAGCDNYTVALAARLHQHFDGAAAVAAAAGVSSDARRLRAGAGICRRGSVVEKEGLRELESSLPWPPSESEEKGWEP